MLIKKHDKSDIVELDGVLSGAAAGSSAARRRCSQASRIGLDCSDFSRHHVTLGLSSGRCHTRTCVKTTS
jgi:hypothetical protein